MAATGPSLKAIVLLVLGLTGAVSALVAYVRVPTADGSRVRGVTNEPVRSLAPAPVERQRLRLYFQAREQGLLEAEEREVAGGTSLGERVRACLAELARGPAAASLQALLPPEVPVRHVFFDASGQAYVDFGAAVRTELAGKDAESQRLVVFSIVNTLLANVEALAAVQLLFEGSEGPRLPGVDLDRPLGARFDLVRTETPGPSDPAEAGVLEGPNT